jgi:hypothetical protein
VKRGRFVLSIAYVVVWTIASTGPATGTSASADASWLPEIRMSNDLPGAPVASGSLTDQHGQATPGRVILLAWPSQAQESRLKVGDSLRVMPVAKATTDATGHFSLRIDPVAPVGEFTTPGGIVDFEILSSTTGASGRLFFSAHEIGSGSSAKWQSTTGTDGFVVASTSISGLPTDAIPAPEPVDKACQEILVSAFPNVIGIVGEVYPGPHATADFSYTQSAVTTAGIGFSSTGAYGSYSLSGTGTFTSTLEVGFPTVAANGKFVEETYFRYGKFNFMCCGKGFCTSEFYSKPYQWIGGTANYAAASAPTATYCTPYLANSKPKVTTSTAVTFSNAIKMGPQIGIDLTGSTGFSTSAQLDYVYASSGTLCGSNDYPGYAARIVGK